MSPVDPISDVLRAVRLEDAIFHVVEATAPWSIRTAAARERTPRIMPAAEHLMTFHVVTAGHCHAGLPGGEQVALHEGDVALFPQGDAHAMSSTSGLRMVSGVFGCDRLPFHPLMAALPRMLVVRRGAAHDSVTHFTQLATQESRRGTAGSACIVTRLAEVMLIEVMRRYLVELPPGQSGWLSGLQDTTVGQVLRLLHNRPGHPWTLAELARRSASSRSRIATRFASLVGEPPMQYLARWRMQVAANLLSESGAKVAAIGHEVGYDSEAAFSRAFKRASGLAPGAWRAARRRRRA